MIRIPRIQTSLAGLFVAVFVISVAVVLFLNHAGVKDAKCKVVFYGETNKVGVRNGPIQIDVETDSYCALVVEDSFRESSDFPLQIGLTREQLDLLQQEIPLNSQFVVRYRSDSLPGLPADDAHDAVVSHLRRYDPSIKYRPR